MDLVAVAEEFILGFPAPTERYSVSNLIEMAVGEFHWDSTTYSIRADDPMAGQHNQRYGGIQVWFDGVTVLVSLNQTTGWAVCGLFGGDLAQNPILQRFHSVADRQLQCQSRGDGSLFARTRSLHPPMPGGRQSRHGLGFAAGVSPHKLAFLQHERLIHLLITLFLSLFALMAIALLIFLPSLTTALLAGLLLVLVGGYLVHYYKLENGVQRLYRLDRKLEEKRGAIPRAL